MENTTKQSMTCESTGMPFTAASAWPILRTVAVERQGSGVSGGGRSADLGHVMGGVDGAVAGFRADVSDYPTTKPFADFVVRSASWSHPV